MSTQITCDYCGLVIEPQDMIKLDALHLGWMVGTMRDIRKTKDLPPQYNRSLDLHLWCYLDRYEPTISQEPHHE